MLSSRSQAAVAVASTSAQGSCTGSRAVSPARFARRALARQQIAPSSPTHSSSKKFATPHSQHRPRSKTAALDNDTVLSAAAASADAAAPIYDVNDPVVTAVFTLATVALSILTLGVAYLSLTGWIDSRNEEAERKRVEAAERSRAMNPSQGSVPRRKNKATDVLTSRGGGKGFSK